MSEESEKAEGQLEPQLLSTGPAETDLVQIMLMMRLYDLGMAILSKLDPETADTIFDAHKEGKDFNPDLFVPEMKQRPLDEG